VFKAGVPAGSGVPVVSRQRQPRIALLVRLDSEELMHSGGAAVETAARDAALKVLGVNDVTVRGRWMGRSLMIEVEGQVASDTTMKNAAQVAEQVEQGVRAAVPSARKVRFAAACSADVSAE
jgi:divalent metal cation (Fe/Co/Zn/Cd) transporter